MPVRSPASARWTKTTPDYVLPSGTQSKATPPLASVQARRNGGGLGAYKGDHSESRRKGARDLLIQGLLQRPCERGDARGSAVRSAEHIHDVSAGCAPGFAYRALGVS